MTVIHGGIFDFFESGYTPPYSGIHYNFQHSIYILNQIWSDDNYVYAACDFGLDVIDKTAEERIAYINTSSGVATVWGNDDRVYFGTLDAGIKYIDKTNISGTVSVPNNLALYTVDYTPAFGVSSQVIRYIHGSGDDYLMCCTAAGVDVYHMKATTYRSSFSTTAAQKCFMTSTGKFYYTTNAVGWALNRVNTSLIDWVEPDYSYCTGSGILAAGLYINDIFITENTAASGTNTAYIATTSGVYVIDEDTLDYGLYLTTTVSGGILPGNDNDFKAVWVDNDRVFIGSAGAFYIVKNGVLIDYYTMSHAGRMGETLNQNDIIDVV